jgi:hypothetical protein
MSISKVGSSAGVTALRGISVTLSIPDTHQIISCHANILAVSCCLTPWTLYSRRPGTVTYSIIIQWTPTWVSTTPWIWVWSMLPHHVLSWSTISKMTNCWLSISFVCWRQNPRYAYVGVSEQRWISNEIISELVHIVVSAHEVGSNTTLLHCEESAQNRHSNIHRIIGWHDDWWTSSCPWQIVGCRFALLVGDRCRVKIITELVNNVVLVDEF